MILVTTGAQGNNVVPRISLFFPFQGESLREMVGACHVSIDARELEVSSEQNFRSAGKCGVVRVAIVRIVEQWFAQIFGKFSF